MLADGRGVLVPWRDPQAIARERRSPAPTTCGALALRSAPPPRPPHALARRRRRLHETFERALASMPARCARPSRRRRWRGASAEPAAAQPRHLRALTDDTGLLQHATFCVPRYDDGYCLDDNARALLLMALMEEAGTEDRDAVRALSTRYLAFVQPAFDPAQGRFRNFMTYGRAGPSRSARRTATATRSGRSAPSSGARRPGTARAWRTSCSTPRCRRRPTSPARAPGPRRCSASTSTCTPSRATAASRTCAATSRIGCSTSTRGPVGRLALVRGRADLRQRAAAACADRLRRADGHGPTWSPPGCAR